MPFYTLPSPVGWSFPFSSVPPPPQTHTLALHGHHDCRILHRWNGPHRAVPTRRIHQTAVTKMHLSQTTSRVVAVQTSDFGRWQKQSPSWSLSCKEKQTTTVHRGSTRTTTTTTLDLLVNASLRGRAERTRDFPKTVLEPTSQVDVSETKKTKSHLDEIPSVWVGHDPSNRDFDNTCGTKESVHSNIGMIHLTALMARRRTSICCRS